MICHDQLVKLISSGEQYKLTSPGALYIKQYDPTSDVISGPNGETEFPWGTIQWTSPGALNIKQ